MSFKQWLAFVGATIGIRWLANHWFPHADAYVIAGVVLGFVLLAIYRHARRYAVAGLESPTVAERDRSAQSLVDVATPPPAAQPQLFVYPGGSRLRSVLGLLVSGIFGVGFLAPIALRREDDPANGWVLFILGTMMVAFTLIHARVLHWVGDSLLVSPKGLTLTRPSGKSASIPWNAVARVAGRRFPASVTFEAADGATITVYPELKNYEGFLAAVDDAAAASHRAS